MPAHTGDPAPPHPPGSEVSWPALAERVIDDLTRVIRVEIQLFENSLSPIFSDLTDRVVANLIAGFAMLAGGIVILAALIMFIRQWLPWWQSLAIGGAVAILAGFILRRFAAPHAGHRDRLDGTAQDRGGDAV